MKQQNRHGISRVIMLYREENFDAALAAFRDTLGIDDFDEPFALPAMGLRVTLSWSCGIEIIAPYGLQGHADHMRTIIAEQGEGFFGIVYEVLDLAAGVERAAGAGHPALNRIDCLQTNPAWGALFSQAIEANLGPVAGIDVTLIQLDRTG